MDQREPSNSFLGAPRLTRTRMIIALAIALSADFLQVVLVPMEAVFIQQFIDVAAMVLTTLVLGFHWLLLPTFIFEFIPFVDMAPTWTGCVAAVIALRRRQQRSLPTVQADPPPPPIRGDQKSLPNESAHGSL